MMAWATVSRFVIGLPSPEYPPAGFPPIAELEGTGCAS
jgi:hypothetical protein